MHIHNIRLLSFITSQKSKIISLSQEIISNHSNINKLKINHHSLDILFHLYFFIPIEMFLNNMF